MRVGKVDTLLLLLLAGGARTQDGVIVSTGLGDIRGTTMTSRNGRTFQAFLGVPYAAPPVGDLRFAAPAPVTPWWGEMRNATADPPLCLQKNYLDVVPQVMGQEDCLYLNAYTPNLRPATPMPVMVYLHGGGFFSGTGGSFLWGPQALLDRDVVLVTLNYRLGVLGFLSTGDSAAPGNFGFKDQVAALRWVQANAGVLGGDPGCITLFGQSAGAVSVHLHMMSPLSAGLFHRAVSQSGTALVAWAWPADARALAERQALFVGCDPDAPSHEMVRCLRAVDPARLVDSGDAFKFWSVDPLDVFGPSVEQGPGAFLVASPFYLLRTGRFTRVPWLTGVVTNEGAVRAAAILSNATLLEQLNARLPVLGPRLFEFSRSLVGGDELTSYVWERVLQYFVGNAQGNFTGRHERALLDMFTDRSFVHGFHKSAGLHRDTGHQHVFLYHFSYRGNVSFSSVFAPGSIQDFGVSHCDDLLYLFHLPLLFPNFTSSPDDLRMSETLITLWTNFAATGRPSHDWEPLSAGEPLSYMEISAGPRLTMKQQPFKERMAFWDSLPLLENNEVGVGPRYYLDLVQNLVVYK